VSLPLYWSGDGKPLRPTQGLKNRSIFPEGALVRPSPSGGNREPFFLCGTGCRKPHTELETLVPTVQS